MSKPAPTLEYHKAKPGVSATTILVRTGLILLALWFATMGVALLIGGLIWLFEWIAGRIPPDRSMIGAGGDIATMVIGGIGLIVLACETLRRVRRRTP